MRLAFKTAIFGNVSPLFDHQEVQRLTAIALPALLQYWSGFAISHSRPRLLVRFEADDRRRPVNRELLHSSLRRDLLCD